MTGYLNNQHFEAEIEVGRAMAFLRKAQAQTALKILEDFIARTTNKSLLPEALYWAGVASFFMNKRNADSLAPY